MPAVALRGLSARGHFHQEVIVDLFLPLRGLACGLAELHESALGLSKSTLKGRAGDVARHVLLQFPQSVARGLLKLIDAALGERVLGDQAFHSGLHFLLHVVRGRFDQVDLLLGHLLGVGRATLQLDEALLHAVGVLADPVEALLDVLLEIDELGDQLLDLGKHLGDLRHLGAGDVGPALEVGGPLAELDFHCTHSVLDAVAAAVARGVTALGAVSTSRRVPAGRVAAHGWRLDWGRYIPRLRDSHPWRYRLAITRLGWLLGRLPCGLVHPLHAVVLHQWSGWLRHADSMRWTTWHLGCLQNAAAVVGDQLASATIRR